MPGSERQPSAPPNQTSTPRVRLREVGEGLRGGPNFFRTRAISWSCFFCRVMELVQLFCSLVSSSSFKRYSRWVS